MVRREGMPDEEHIYAGSRQELVQFMHFRWVTLYRALKEFFDPISFNLDVSTAPVPL